MKLTAIVLIGQDNNEVKAKRARLADSPRFAGEAGAMAKRAIDSVSFADEVLVVNEKFPISDFSEVRNRALDRAGGEWVLFLDCDEIISEDLSSEIKSQISNLKSQNHNSKFKTNTVAGFSIKRKDYFLRKWLKYGETANVRLLRLAKKDAGQWVRPVHEVWKVKGKIGELKNPLLHYSHETVEEMVEKLDRYSEIEAEYRASRWLARWQEFARSLSPTRYARGGLGRQLAHFANLPTLLTVSTRNSFKWIVCLQLMFFPSAKFIQNYIFRLGFLDGIPGFIHAGMMSLHSFLVRAKLLERYE